MSDTPKPRRLTKRQLAEIDERRKTLGREIDPDHCPECGGEMRTDKGQVMCAGHFSDAGWAQSAPCGWSAPVSPPPTSPEWGEPRRMEHYGPGAWLIVADCDCSVEVWGSPDAVVAEGHICAGHTFADLVSGERRLRAAQGRTETIPNTAPLSPHTVGRVARRWFVRYRCGCSDDAARKRDLLEYCAKHGDDAVELFPLPVRQTQEEAPHE